MDSNTKQQQNTSKNSTCQTSYAEPEQPQTSGSQQEDTKNLQKSSTENNKMRYNLKELRAELEDQKYEMYETFVIDFDDVITAIGNLEKELRELYIKLCEDRIGDIGIDNKCFLIEEIFDAEADEIFGEQKLNPHGDVESEIQTKP